MSLDVAWVIIIGSMLSFVGLGVQPPEPSLGTMVADGARYLPDQWWIAVFPALAIVVVVLGFNLLGDGVRDMFAAEGGLRWPTPLLLEIKNLQVHFKVYGGRLKVLDGINFTVHEGEKVGLVGETGCGKTTTMKAILRVLPMPPARIPRGEILLQGPGHPEDERTTSFSRSAGGASR